MTTGDARRRPRRLLLVGVVLAGLLLGAAAGWAVAVLARPEALPSSSRPLPADNPDVPSAPADSSGIAPLGTDLDYVDASVDSLGTTWELVRPAGWEERSVARGIRWVLPGDPVWTYSVRVAPTPGSSSTAQLARGRLDDIRQAQADGSLADVELVDLTGDAVVVTYVQEGHLKYQHTRFVRGAPGSPTSVFEVSTSGRIEDRDGLDALADRMADSVRRG